MSKFSELNIDPIIISTLEALNINEPTKIQELSIPIIKEGKDIIAQAKTGTGKTFSYLIPILEKIDFSSHFIQALIVCPTRELTNQVADEIFKLTKNMQAIKYACITGGASYEKQFKQLQANPQIVVSTPGRILDHMDRKTVKINNIKFLVLDEADEMLKMGFKEDLENIIKTTPPLKQTLLFSATIPPFIKQIAQTYQNSPVFIQADKNDMNVSKIKQFYFDVKKKDKLNLLIRLIDLYQFDSAMIFANTKIEVDEINAFLNKNNIISSAIHGDLKQSDRDKVMQQFKRHITKILVGSDVAARGLDIENVGAVINYELPFESELYIHRIGRTGRADKKGMSFSLVSPSEKSRLKNIINVYNSEIKLKEIPTVESLSSVISVYNEQLLDTIIQEDNSQNLVYTNKLLERYSAEEIINALLKNNIVGNREYPEIEIVKQQTSSSSKSSFSNSRANNNGSNREQSNSNKDKKTFTKVEINLGDDNLSRTDFLEFLDKKLKIYTRHVKSFKMTRTKSILEIESDYYRFLVKANDKTFFNKKLEIKRIS
jgi:ATP-dependent RNA helicase DeaD